MDVEAVRALFCFFRRFRGSCVARTAGPVSAVLPTGTQRIFDFVPMVQNVKSEACTYVIDELDRSLHPTLVPTLVSRIVTDKNMMGQLIFTTHDAGLLDGKVFRNDEIWFAEKDRETTNITLFMTTHQKNASLLIIGASLVLRLEMS